MAENKHLGTRSSLSLPVTHVLLFRCYPRRWAQHTHPHLEAPGDTGHSQQLGCASTTDFLTQCRTKHKNRHHGANKLPGGGGGLGRESSEDTGPDPQGPHPHADPAEERADADRTPSSQSGTLLCGCRAAASGQRGGHRGVPTTASTRPTQGPAASRQHLLPGPPPGPPGDTGQGTTRDAQVGSKATRATEPRSRAPIGRLSFQKKQKAKGSKV